MSQQRDAESESPLSPATGPNALPSNSSSVGFRPMVITAAPAGSPPRRTVSSSLSPLAHAGPRPSSPWTSDTRSVPLPHNRQARDSSAQSLAALMGVPSSSSSSSTSPVGSVGGAASSNEPERKSPSHSNSAVDESRSRSCVSKDETRSQAVADSSLSRVPRYLGLSNYHTQLFASGSSSAKKADGRQRWMLPSRWDSNKCNELLTIMEDGLQVLFRNNVRNNDKDAAAVKTDHPIPVLCGVYYYEVHILSKGVHGYIGVGFSAPSVHLGRLPGWEDRSYGYHGDDGHIFSSHGTGKPFGPTFTTGDVVGCGVDFSTHRCFFTKNGSLVGHCFQDVRGELYPSIGLRTAGEMVKANFGQDEFRYDIEQHVRDRRTALQTEIDHRVLDERYLDPEDVSTSKPSGAEEDREQVQSIDATIAKLVSSYLTFHGHSDTVAAFDADRAAERETVQDLQSASSSSNMALDEANEAEESLESVRFRKEVMSSTRAGRLTEALELVQNRMSDALGVNMSSGPPMGFVLRAHIILDAMLSLSSSAKATDDALDERVLPMLQSLYADYGEDAPCQATLVSLSSLLAYPDPRSSDDAAVLELVEQSGRKEELADELNAAMHVALGHPRDSGLGRIGAQCAAMRKQLGEMGEGTAAFLEC